MRCNLDNQLILQQFQEIERKVDRLIETCRKYEAENLELNDKIRQLEEVLQEKTLVEKEYQEEKSLIRSRIDNLLVRLETLTEAESEENQ
jgi:chromosome segregation ATPase